MTDACQASCDPAPWSGWLGDLFFAREAGTVTFEAVVARFAAYVEAFERILGAPEGTVTIIDGGTLREWYG